MKKGNSSYSATIASTLFPVYYTNEIVGNENRLGALWGEAISISMALSALLGPYIGGIADHLRIRKRMLILFTFLCILSVASFSFLEKGMAKEGSLLIVLANFGMESAFIFYNSFLPQLKRGSGIGKMSALGFGTGYLGSIVSLFSFPSSRSEKAGKVGLVFLPPFFSRILFAFILPPPPLRTLLSQVYSFLQKRSLRDPSTYENSL
jgi:MFS-type transporter involved in bile tolerance (Atg22 family)